ncbi:unnamed protein product [Menidia menidia]|uniref:(Atlantic silverside) hypothetical protein n=1 Tax=Menidia menidia TaxID=238744 RepID=A0A8S4C2J1_9TELE|nr:unnamed protein product [Menidia menidia]
MKPQFKAEALRAAEASVKRSSLLILRMRKSNGNRVIHCDNPIPQGFVAKLHSVFSQGFDNH